MPSSGISTKLGQSSSGVTTGDTSARSRKSWFAA